MTRSIAILLALLLLPVAARGAPPGDSTAADQERARQDQERARRDQERARSDRDRARRERERAERERERVERERERTEQQRERAERERERLERERARGERERDRLERKVRRAPDAKPLSATVAVRGPVSFTLRTMAADVEVAAAAGKQVTLTVTDGDAREAKLVVRGDRVEAEFDGHATLRTGRAQVTVPRGSSLDVKTVSGNLAATGTGGDVRFRSMAGNARVRQIAAVEAQTVAGDVDVKDATGAVRVQTVSGRTDVRALAAPVRFDYETTTGDLVFAGACGAKCRLGVHTLTGEVTLLLDPRSSFELRLQSHQGDLKDELGMTVAERRARQPRGTNLVARYGKAEGVIEVRTFSGDLAVRKR